MSEWAVLKRLGHRDRFEDLRKMAAGTFRQTLMHSRRGLSHVHSYRDG